MMCRQTVGLICFLLFAFKNSVNAGCFSVRNLRTNSPLIVYKYKSDGTPIFHYPHVDDGCIINREGESEHIHFTCPGHSCVILRATNSIGNSQVASSRSIYIDRYDSFHGLSSRYGAPGHSLECSENDGMAMMTETTNKNSKQNSSISTYEVFYTLNEMDELTVYKIVVFEDERKLMHFRMPSAIKIELSFSVQHDQYVSGSIYSDMSLDFTELYSREYQMDAFQNYFEDSGLKRRYFSGNDSLVAGQLILKEDMFYTAEKMSTLFYENTVPIWKSVYEGNWQSVGEIIRKIADESARDLEVFVTTWGKFYIYGHDSDSEWTLGATEGSSDTLAIPYVLVKAAVDVNNYDRGIVFHTFNDPHLDSSLAKMKLKNYCSKTTNCNELNPELPVSAKGFTFCCRPRDSHIFQKYCEEAECKFADNQ